MKYFKPLYFIFILFFLTVNLVNAQVLISDDSGTQTPDPSAILEVKSTTQGLLIPRMNSEQRALLEPTAAEGLLIYDTDEGAFFLKGSGSWIDLSSSAEIWSKSASNVYLTDGTDNIGVGTSSPGSKFVIQADATDTRDDVLFEVVGTDGIPVFEVTTNGVKISVNGDAKAISRGFAVGQYNTAKLTEFKDYFTVDNLGNAKVHMHDDGTKAISGGFAVGQYNTAKDFTPIEEYLNVAPDKIQVNNTVDGGKAVSGGFAVGQYNTAKGRSDFMHITLDNYFIGHESGSSLTTGLYNSVFGYQSGKFMTTGDENVFLGYHAGLNNLDGYKNVFIGFEAGMSITGNTYSDMGSNNVFIGSGAGRNATGSVANIAIGTNAGAEDGYLNTFVGNSAGNKQTGWDNAFFGYHAGQNSTTGDGNVCIGSQAGESLSTGNRNILIGEEAGLYAYYANNNIAIGYQAGRSIRGEHNVLLGEQAGYTLSTADDGNILIGYQAGYSETGSNNLYIENSNSGIPLIYGNFAADLIGVNERYPTANLHVKQVGTGEEGFAIENDDAGGSDIWSWEIGSNVLFLYYNSIQKGSWNDVSGVYTAVSDKRLKTDIEKIPNVLDKINQLEVVKYYFKDDKKRETKSIGLIAQDVEKIFPSIVSKPEEGTDNTFYSMDYSAFGPIAIKAIQEQQEQIEDLKKQIQELKDLIQK